MEVVRQDVIHRENKDEAMDHERLQVRDVRDKELTSDLPIQISMKVHIRKEKESQHIEECVAGYELGSV